MIDLIGIGVAALGIYVLTRAEPLVDRLRTRGIQAQNPRAPQVALARVYGALAVVVGLGSLVWAATFH